MIRPVIAGGNGSTRNAPKGLVPGLVALNVLVSTALAIYVWIQLLGTPHCGQSCDFELISRSVYGFLLADLVLVIGSLVGVAILSAKGMWMVLPVVAGIALVCIAAAIALIFLNVGLRY